MLNPTHLQAAVLFALFASAVLGVVGRSTDRERVGYALYCFGYFLAAVFVLGWLMRLGHAL